MSASQITTVTAEMIQAYKENFAKTESLERYLSNAKRDFSNLKNLKRTVDKVEPEIKKLKTTTKIVDALKRGAFKEINPSWGTRFAAFIGVLNAGFTTFLVKKNEEIQELNIQSQKATEAGVADAFTRTINNSILIRGLNTRVKDVELSDQRTRDRVYGLEQQNITINDGIEIAAQKANDALYEARQGRVIVEQKINDNLYEAREGKKKTDANLETYRSDLTKLRDDFSKYLRSIGDGAKNSLQDTVSTIQKNLNTTNATVAEQGRLLIGVQTTIKDIQSTVTGFPKAITDLRDSIIKLTNDRIKPIELAQKAQDTVNKSFVERKELTGITTSLKATYDLSFEAQAAKFNEANRKLQGDINTIKSVTVSSDFKSGTADLTKQVTQLKTDIGNVKTDIDTTKADIKKIDTKLKEQERVNQEGNRKLDQLFPLVSGLPLVVGRAEQNIINKMPTPAQMSDAAASGVCRTAQPGGCMSNALQNTSNDIKTNNNNNAGSILDAVNTGANAALLAGQQTILARLGAQVPGGISGFMNRIVKNQWVDRAINLVTMTAAVHNVVMLSDAATTTFFGILDNVLAIPALIVDPNAETIDTKQAFGGVVDGFFKSIFGVTEWAQIKARWNTVNRIYQAGANGINEVRSIGGNIIGAVEQTARLTGKGFNAMQDEGLLSESNWDYSPENLKLKGGLFAKFGKLADGINIATEGLEAIESITSEIRSAVDSANQIKENAKEVDDGLKELFTQSKTQREAEVEALPAKSYSWEDLI